jgi:transposase
MTERINHDRNAIINELRLQGYSCAQIAEQLGVSPATVIGAQQRHSTLYRSGKGQPRKVSLPKLSFLDGAA